MSTLITNPNSEAITLPNNLKGPDGLHLTPLGNAERLLRDYGQDILWTPGNTHTSCGSFYTWDGSRWTPDAGGRVNGWATKTARNLGVLVKTAVDNGVVSDAVKVLTKFWAASETEHGIGSIVACAAPMVSIDPRQFDANPMLLGVQNGVVDLRDGTFRKADRLDYLTKLCNANFDAEAKCPTWERFLLETAGGDEGLVRYLQACIGFCLTGLTEEHLFFIVTGPGGTGKTTFAEALVYVWGEYACGIDPNSLSASNKPEAARARPDIAKLPGVRLAFANESRAGLRIDEGLLKAMSGNDTLTARALYKAEFDFKPTHKLWLRTNFAPQFDGGDSGMRRRTRLVPFEHVVQSKDVKLPTKLRDEADGILQWALRGLAEYQSRGLREPEVIVNATESYLDSLDTIQQFIAECCVVKATADAPAGDTYKAYRKWVGDRGMRPTNDRRFRIDLEGRGYRQRVLQGKRLYSGLELKPEAMVAGMIRLPGAPSPGVEPGW